MGERGHGLRSVCSSRRPVSTRFRCGWRERAGAPGMLHTMLVDRFSLYFFYLFLAATAVAILMSVRYLETEHENHGEYYALMLLSVAGMMCMAAGFDVVLIFIGLELMAMSTYVLVGFLRRDRRSNEAALKYFLLGAFSLGHLRLRTFPALWTLRQHPARRDPSGTGKARARSAISAGRGDCAGHDHDRAALQDRGRPLSPVGAGRLRRRANQHHRIHVRRRQGRGMGDAAPHPDRRTPADAFDVGSHARLRLYRDDDGSQFCRAHANQHQAPARLFVNRPRRIHAARPDRRHRARNSVPTASKASSFTCSSTRS